jgi:hypothetical protein
LTALAADLDDAAAVAERPPAERPALRLFEPSGSSLEDAILGAWEDLVASGRTDCPVCGGTLRAASGCDNCGSDLS